MNVDRALRKLQNIAMESVRRDSVYTKGAARAISLLADLRFDVASSKEARAVIGKTLQAVGLVAKPARRRRRSDAALAASRYVPPQKFTDEALLSGAWRAPRMSALAKILGANRKTIRARFEKIYGRTDQSALLAVKPWLRRGSRRGSHANGMVQETSSE